MQVITGITRSLHQPA